MRTGDTATFLPFFMNPYPAITYTRRWLEVHPAGRYGSTNHHAGETGDLGFRGKDARGGDALPRHVNEAVALDYVLPPSGLDPDKPFYLLLHGLSGGSDEVPFR